MKKRICSLFLCLAICLCIIPTASAAENIDPINANETLISSHIEYFDDGGYAIIEVSEITMANNDSNIASRSSTVSKVGSKKTSHYNSSNELLYSITVTATFEYISGTSVECVGQTYSTEVIASGYSFEDAVATRSNYSTSKVSATASATAVKKTLFVVVGRTPISSTIYCDYNGNLS